MIALTKGKEREKKEVKKKDSKYKKKHKLRWQGNLKY